LQNNKEKRFLISYRRGIYPVKARNRKEAYAKFFFAVQNGEINFRDLGHIIVLKDGKDEYPFRTVPSLWLLGIIDQDTAIANIRLAVGCSEHEAFELLIKTAHQDSWILTEVEKIKINLKRGEFSNAIV